jgi:hypothetical protein
MGADTNELDTRDEDKARTEGRLAEFWEKDTSYTELSGVAAWRGET